ncbi:flavin reductase family protein [Brevibacterium linens]|uniref:Flavin reductase domain protein FMN-binding protein n=1 Tax=Brevibacterium linens TaxID=1703 RepID=A0A0B8ZUV4_BRELN|nr:flavin reductase family protein [Brevibacterium linens]KHS50202.1 flavin reductase domain protein FMN-binding protein [Brevibacterium linens]
MTLLADPTTQSPAPVTPATPETLRETFSHFPQGVAFIGAEVDAAPLGLVASTLTVGVSLDPPLVSVAVQNSSTTWPTLRRAPELGISLLGSDQEHLARQLASKDRGRRFTGVSPEVTAGGGLTIPGSSAFLWTRLYEEVAAGDHTVALLEILGTRNDDGPEALVFHRSEFKGLRVS